MALLALGVSIRLTRGLPRIGQKKDHHERESWLILYTVDRRIPNLNSFLVKVVLSSFLYLF